MKVNRYEAKDIKGNELTIIPLGDMHVGAKECNLKKFQEYVDWIEKKPNVKVILMGDLINCGTKVSVGGGAFDDIKNPQEQIDTVIDILMPIKDKILGLHTGNHEERIRQLTSIDVSRLMARALGVKYFGYSVFHKIKFGKQNYIFYSTHGSSGALETHTKVRAAIRLSESFDAEVYLMGHVHDIAIHSSVKYSIDMRHANLVQTKKYFVLTGHFLNYHDGYAEQKCMKPTKQGVVKIKLYKDRKDIHISE